VTNILKKLIERIKINSKTGCWEWNGALTTAGYGQICCNPLHLEAVTRRINQIRSNSVSGINSRKKSCPKGHPFNDGNTVKTSQNGRLCHICKLAYWRNYRLKRIKEGTWTKK